MSNETQVGDIQDIRWGEGRAWRERPSHVHLRYCSETGAESVFVSAVIPLHIEQITCWGSSGPLSEIKIQQHVWLSQEIMACGLLIGRAGRSHFHFVLTECARDVSAMTKFTVTQTVLVWNPSISWVQWFIWIRSEAIMFPQNQSWWRVPSRSYSRNKRRRSYSQPAW